MWQMHSVICTSFCSQEAEVGGKALPEPFDVRTEHATEAKMLNFDTAEVGAELGEAEGTIYNVHVCLESRCKGLVRVG